MQLHVKESALTHCVGLSVKSRHHQWRPTRACVRYVRLGSVAQEKGNALHVVGKRGGVKGGPALTRALYS